jgi:hypothetical protein
MKKDEKQEVVSSGTYCKQLCQITKTWREVITCINQGIDERILLDWVLKGIGCPDSSCWGCGPVVGSCQHGNVLKRRHFMTSGLTRSLCSLYVLLPLPPFESVEQFWWNSIWMLYHSQFHPF